MPLGDVRWWNKPDHPYPVRLCGVDRKWRFGAARTVVDPGCVKKSIRRRPECALPVSYCRPEREGPSVWTQKRHGCSAIRWTVAPASPPGAGPRAYVRGIFRIGCGCAATTGRWTQSGQAAACEAPRRPSSPRFSAKLAEPCGAHRARSGQQSNAARLRAQTRRPVRLPQLVQRARFEREI
jgi:hypothetical protein